MKKIAYQKYTVTVPAATPIGQPVQLTIPADTNYERITGIGFVRLSGADQLNLSFRKNNTEVIEPIDSSFLLATNVTGSTAAKFWSIDEDSKNGNVTFLATPELANTGGINVFQFILRLENK